MSAHLHRAQLQQWLAEQPLRNASFHIKPVQTKTIYRAVYNKEKVSLEVFIQYFESHKLNHKTFENPGKLKYQK